MTNGEAADAARTLHRTTEIPPRSSSFIFPLLFYTAFKFLHCRLFFFTPSPSRSASWLQYNSGLFAVPLPTSPPTPPVGRVMFKWSTSQHPPPPSLLHSFFPSSLPLSFLSSSLPFSIFPFSLPPSFLSSSLLSSYSLPPSFLPFFSLPPSLLFSTPPPSLCVHPVTVYET